MYQTVKITSNDIERKQGKLIATNYAYNTYYDRVFESSGNGDYTIETNGGVTTVNYVNEDVIVSSYSDSGNKIVTSTFKNKYIIKLTIDDSNKVIKLEEGE